MRRVILVLVVPMGLLAHSTFATDSSVPFINANAVHALGFTGQDVTVAVIDTGIYYNQPGLGGSIASGGMSWINGEPVYDGGADIYGYGHGTYMSLIITDSTGVAPDALILPVRVAFPVDVELAITTPTGKR